VVRIRTIMARIIINMVVITIRTKVINKLDQITLIKTMSWMNIMTSICTPELRKMEIKAITLGTPEIIVEMEVGMCTEIQEELHVKMVTQERHTIRSNNNTKPNRTGMSSPMGTAVTHPNKMHTITVILRHLRKEL
jgi:hypothetical protein